MFAKPPEAMHYITKVTQVYLKPVVGDQRIKNQMMTSTTNSMILLIM